MSEFYLYDRFCYRSGTTYRETRSRLIGVRPTCQQTHPGYTTNGRQGRRTYPIDVSAAWSTPKAPAAALAHMRHGAIHTSDLARTAIAAVQRGPCATSWHVPALRMTVGKGAATAGVLRRRRGQRGWRQQRQEDGHARGRTGCRKLEAGETGSWASIGFLGESIFTFCMHAKTRSTRTGRTHARTHAGRTECILLTVTTLGVLVVKPTRTHTCVRNKS